MNEGPIAAQSSGLGGGVNWALTPRILAQKHVSLSILYLSIYLSICVTCVTKEGKSTIFSTPSPQTASSVGCCSVVDAV